MVNNVRVAVRVRPFNQREIERNAKVCIQMDKDKKKTTITNPEDGRVREFTFDYSYWSHNASDEHFVDQEEVFNNLGVDCLESAWEGYNCSLFAYGQTGSGKSFSMVGNAASDEVLAGSQAGIVPRVCRTMFDRIAAMDEPSVTFKVETSMLEIYNEQVRDLFNPTNAPPSGLKVREHPTTGPFVDGLSSLLVENNAAIERLMEQGTKARTIASTKMNKTSSRAHTIFQIILTQTRVDKDAGQATDRVSRINLVDLAGSERAKSTGASGDRLKEGIQINKSLSALGNCIKLLAEKAKQSEGGSKRSKIHVPYRDSILTLLLKDSLGGNARTVMIAALSPADINFDETLSTLQYADRAKRIQNVAVVNEDQNEKMVRELREEVAALRKQLEGQAQQKVDEDAEAARKKLEEELAESQRLMAQLQMTWAEKQKATEAIEQERNKALEAMGVVVDVSLQGQPQLVNLNEDASLSGCLVYFLRVGDTLVGKAQVGGEQTPGEIRLQGLGIATEHCRLTHTPAGEEGSPTVTLHPNGGVAAKTFVNGKQASSDGVQLRHGDRVIFGSSNFFKYTDPAEAKRIREAREAALEANTNGSDIEPTNMDVVDWEFAQNERLQEAMASSLEDSNAAKAALEKAQQDFAEQEAKLAAEKAEAEARLVEQQNAFNAQIAEQTGNADATEAALEEAKAQLEAQRVAFEQELVAKEAALDAKRQELHREQVRERQQALLEDKLHQLIPLVEESNLLSAELRREALFEVKVVSDYVQQTAAAAAAGDRMEPRTLAKVKVTYLKQDRSCLWEQDKFSNRIYLMRELYARFIDDPSCLAEVTPDVDPFYDPPESQLIGVAHILLEPLAYQLDIQQKTPVVDYQGNTVGSLAVELVPCTPDGATEGVDLVDSPDELVGRRMDLLMSVKSASELDKRYLSQSSFVCHKFYLDDDVSRTITAPPSGNPVYNYCRQITVDPMDATFVQFIQEASMTFEVWSQPLDDLNHVPMATTPEPRSAATPELSAPLGQVAAPHSASDGPGNGELVEPTSEPEPEDSLNELQVPPIELKAADTQPDLESLRASLQPLKLSELKKRAAAAGVSAEEIEQVDDHDDPKAAVIELLAAALASTKETPREVRLERRVTEAEAQAAEAAARVAELEEALKEQTLRAGSAEKAERAARLALVDAETRLTEQKSATCVVS